MANFLATHKPVPRLTTPERILLYGIGCRVLLVALSAVDYLLGKLYELLDRLCPGDPETPTDVHESVEWTAHE